MNMKTLSLGYSPCPNDTFLFSGIASGALTMPGVDFDIQLADIDTLNQAAENRHYDIVKVSFATYLKIRADYELLDTGAALGFGCGPLLLSARPQALDEVEHCRIAFPGESTTAYLLFRLLGIASAEHHFIPYDQIIPRMQAGEFDCGVIIHESRFTYAAAGLHCLLDLGAWWEEQTGLPIPLGCFVMRKSLCQDYQLPFEALMRASMRQSRTGNVQADAYIRAHAQEMAPEVLQKHIDLYVNDFSYRLGDLGRQAVAALASKAERLGAGA